MFRPEQWFDRQATSCTMREFTARPDSTPPGFATPRSHVVILAPTMDGHRFNYVRILLAACDRRGAPVTVLTTAEGREEFVAKNEGGPAPYWEILEPGSDRLRALAETSRRLGASLVVVPDGDHLAFDLARRGRWHGRGELRILVMREFAQPGARPALARPKTLLRKSLFRFVDALPGVRLFILGSALLVEGDAGGRRGAFARVPDPIEFEPSERVRQALRAEAGLEPATYWFAIAGWLDERKNIPLVLAALRSASDLVDRPVGLLLAGRQNESVRTAVAGHARAEHVALAQLDRHLTSTELDSAISLADCLVLAHSNEGPSGILGKAAAAGKPVLAAGARTLRTDCATMGHAENWVELEPQALAGAMARLVITPSSGQVQVAGPETFAATLLGPVT